MILTKREILELPLQGFKVAGEQVVLPQFHSNLSGLECMACETIVWFDSEKFRLRDYYSSPPKKSECGPSYKIWSEAQTKLFLSRIGICCPKCGEKTFSLVSSELSSIHRFRESAYESWVALSESELRMKGYVWLLEE